MTVSKIRRRQERMDRRWLQQSCSSIGLPGWRFKGVMIMSLVVSFVFAGVPVWASEEPTWPSACLGLHEEVTEPALVKRYRVSFDRKPAGDETFCVVRTKADDVVYQWTSNAIHKFLGWTAIRHCRMEKWRHDRAERGAGTAVVDPRRRLELREMQAWTNVVSGGTHSLAAFLNQVPAPSSIKAVQRADGSYRYALMDPSGDAEREHRSVHGAALRTPWTESMLPASSINLMDPVRYRISRGTSVVAREPDPSLPIPHRRYRMSGPDFEFDLMFRADDGTLLKMDGRDVSADVLIVLVDNGAETRCPHPVRLD